MANSYEQHELSSFGGGGNLRDAPDAVQPNQAIDFLNVIYPSRFAVAQRSGYRKFTAAEGTNRYDSLSPFYKFDGTRQIVAGAGSRLEAIDTSGAVLASSAAPTASPHFFQRFGGPTAEHIYISNGTDTVRRWDGIAFSTPAYTGVTPTGKFLGLSSTDNRLVCARFSGSAAGDNPSTVRFSQEGDPTIWDVTWYKDLTPGDGEQIMGVASWQDKVFVFKQSKFFVFYGVQPDDEGDPDFLSRPVEGGVGLASTQALAVAENGVYFLDRHGVYFTNGGDPVRVSDPVEPIFLGSPSLYYQGGVMNDAVIAQATMSYHADHLFLSFSSESSIVNNRQLVFNIKQQWWTLFDFPAGPMAFVRVGDSEELLFGYASGLKHIGRYVEGRDAADDVNTDGTGGTAITARWRGGWFAYGAPVVKTVRESKVSGVGKVKVSWYRDYRNTQGLNHKTLEFSPVSARYDSGLLYDSGVLYGPSTMIQTKPFRRAIRGNVFSLGFSNSELGRTFSVNKLTAHVREARAVSVVKVD